jgi:hypothetical protein
MLDMLGTLLELHTLCCMWYVFQSLSAALSRLITFEVIFSFYLLYYKPFKIFFQRAPVVHPEPSTCT